jgi:hypothetical protein
MTPKAHEHHRQGDEGYFEVVTNAISEHAQECAETLPRIYVTWSKIVAILAGVLVVGASAAWVISERIGAVERKVDRVELIADKVNYLVEWVDSVRIHGIKVIR